MTDTSTEQIENAATLLVESRVNRQRFAGFPASSKPADEAQAYVIQEALHRKLTAYGWGRVVGHKIGCTTKVMQEFLRIGNPCAGGVFDSTVNHGVGHIQIPAKLRVGVECEIAVVLGEDLSPDDAPFEQARLNAAIAGCLAAIEVVEDRYINYQSLDASTLIADDFFGAGCVLGPVVKGFNPSELSSVTAQMLINGVEVGTGRGTDVLGDPLNALAWLATGLAQRGEGLRRGEFVLLGSLVQTHWVEPGNKVVIRNNPLGEVQAFFT